MKVQQNNITTKSMGVGEAVKLMFSTFGTLVNDGNYPLAWFENQNKTVRIHPMANDEIVAEISKYSTSIRRN